MIGPFPERVWRVVVGTLAPASPGFRPDRDCRAAVLALRAVCSGLCDVVANECVGGAGRLDLAVAGKCASLDAGPTAGFGRALVVSAVLQFVEGGCEEDLLAAVATLATAAGRGHGVLFAPKVDGCTPAVVQAAEAVLLKASRQHLLLDAMLFDGTAHGWSVDTMSQLETVSLTNPEHVTVEEIVGAGTAQRLVLSQLRWADLTILSTLREVKLSDCDAVEDLSPLADVPLLTISLCDIEALPAMRNHVLEVDMCSSLTDVSGLAGSRVGLLSLNGLDNVEDLSAIGKMQPPPRTVILGKLAKVHDVSMLAGVRRLEVTGCAGLDETATRAALEGKVGTIRWRKATGGLFLNI